MNKQNELSHKEFLMIAIPFILSTMTQPLLGAVDTAVMGRLGDPAYIAGVSIGTVIFNTMYWIFGFLRVSTTGYSAQAFGRNNDEEKMAAFFRPVFIAIVVGTFLVIFQQVFLKAGMLILSPEQDVQAFASTYFKVLIWGAPFVLVNYVTLGWLMGQAKVKASLFMQITGNVVNIVLDILFVYVWGMGVFGVAIATLISQAGTFAIGIYLIFKYGKFDKQTVKIREMITSKVIIEAMKSNSDLMIRTVCLLIQVNVFSASSASFGTVLLSANAILLQIASILSYIFDGLANATSVYAGKARGQSNAKLLKLTWKRAGQWTVTLMILLTTIYGVFYHQIIGVFSNIPGVTAAASTYALWILAFPLVAGVGLVFYGVFTGTTATRPVRDSTILAVITFLIVWKIVVPIWGNHGLWISFLCFYLGRSVFLMVQLNQTLFKIEDPRTSNS